MGTFRDFRVHAATDRHSRATAPVVAGYRAGGGQEFVAGVEDAFDSGPIPQLHVGPRQIVPGVQVGRVRQDGHLERGRRLVPASELRRAESQRAPHLVTERLQTTLYAVYAARQHELLEWGEGRREVGVRKEGLALQFEIEREVRLAKYLPEPEPVGEARTAALPTVGGLPRPLSKSHELLRRLVGGQHPSIAVRNATAARYAAMSERAERAGRPWFDFVDWAYTIEQGRHDEISGQIAVRVPIGSASDASAGRFRALERASHHEAKQVLEDGVHRALEVLEEIERFQNNTARWQALLNLAEEAEEVAERWRSERLAGPPTVATLFDRAYEARRTVLLARMRAGLASCELVATTGVWIDDWPSTP